nr:type IV secretion system DNA-binding domain-containing protein [Candidatus Freyarchaeota archaeon]
MSKGYPDKVDDPIQFILDKFEDEEIIIDAFYQWAMNPTSESAGFGVSENYPFIKENIKLRYNISEKDSEEYINKLKDACDWLISIKGMNYELRREIRTVINYRFGEKLRSKILKRVKESPIDLKRASYIFGKFIFSNFPFIREGDINQERFSAIYNVSIRSIGSIEPVLKDLTKIGILNKLLWISSGTSGKVAHYEVPLFVEEILNNIDSYLKRPKTPDVNKYISALFDENNYEQLRVIDEVLNSKDYGVRGLYGDTKELLHFAPSTGIIRKYKNIVAISPLIIDKLEEILLEEKEKRIKILRNKIEEKLESLRKEHQPLIEIFHEDENIWKIESMDDPTLYIYLSTWLITNNIKNKFEDRDSHLLIVVTNQSFPSIKNFIENHYYFGLVTSISVLYIDDKKSEFRMLRGQKHKYLEQIVNGITARKEATPKPGPQPPVSLPDKEITKYPETDLKILLGIKDNNEKVFWEPKNERSWNFVIVGSAGTGKTQTVQAILQEFAKNKLPYIIFDFRKDYISVETKTSLFGPVLDLNKISINPLELDGNNSPKEQKYQISDIIDLVYNIGDLQIQHIRNAIKASYEDKKIYEEDKQSWNNDPPTFNDIQDNLNRIYEVGGSVTQSSIQGIFARLDPIFDFKVFSAETVIPFEKIMVGQTVIDLGSLPNDNIKAIVCELFIRKLRYYLYRLPESREPKLYVIVDEAHRLKYDKKSSMGQLLKEGRKYGVGVILSTQDPVDFPDLVFNNIGGVMSLQLTDPKFAKNMAEHLGGEITWKNVKNDLSQKFSAYVKFSNLRDVTRFKVIPYYERQ